GIRHQCHPDAAARQINISIVWSNIHALTQFRNTLGVPHTQECEGGAERDDTSNDVGELVREEVRGSPLCQGERQTNDKGSGRCFLHTAVSIEDEQDNERNNERQKWGLVANDGRDIFGLFQGTSTDFTRGGNRNSDCTESYRSGIGNKHDGRGTQRRDTQGQDHRCGNSHWSTESGESFQKTAETKGDQNGLDANIAFAEDVEGAPQVFKSARGHGDFIKPNGHHDDEHNGQQAKECAATCGRQNQINRHAHADERNNNRSNKCDSAGGMSAGFDGEQHVKERYEGYGRS